MKGKEEINLMIVVDIINKSPAPPLISHYFFLYKYVHLYILYRRGNK